MDAISTRSSFTMPKSTHRRRHPAPRGSNAVVWNAITPAPAGSRRTQASPARDRRRNGWRRSDSNRRPPACKAGALPLSYAPGGQTLAGDTAATGAVRHRAYRGSAAIGRPAARADHRLRHPSGGFSAPQARKMGQGGLEPPTPRLSSVCSNQLSYWPSGPAPRPAQHPGHDPDTTRTGARSDTTQRETRAREPPRARPRPRPVATRPGQARRRASRGERGAGAGRNRLPRAACGMERVVRIGRQPRPRQMPRSAPAAFLERR